MKMSNKVDPRVARMLHSRMASAQDPSKAKTAAPMFAKGGVTRADGCCQRGKTKGRMV
jgi:hypothetical protein